MEMGSQTFTIDVRVTFQIRAINVVGPTNGNAWDLIKHLGKGLINFFLDLIGMEPFEPRGKPQRFCEDTLNGTWVTNYGEYGISGCYVDGIFYPGSIL